MVAALLDIGRQHAIIALLGAWGKAMFKVLVVLAFSSLLDLIAGTAWLLSMRGRARTFTGGETPGFRGRSAGAETGVEVGYGEVKALVRAGRWSEALPLLLMIGGMLGIFLFGSLAFWVRSENELLGLVVFCICLYTVGRILYGILRA
jgi:hypothetical protein